MGNRVSIPLGGRIHGARGVIGRSHNKRTQKFRILVTNKDSGTFCHVEGTFGENFGGVSARIWLTRKLGKKDRQNHRKEPNHMNREEILAKSRAEKMDEGMQGIFSPEKYKKTLAFFAGMVYIK